MATTRAQAIEKLAVADLGRLTSAERAEQLEVMTLEDWSESRGWNDLPRDVRAEFANGEVSQDPSARRYDGVLLIWLRSRYVGATNAYLRGCLSKIAPDVAEVVGPEDTLVPCPCCGRATLPQRGWYDICKVCWWEDDGQDNSKADIVMGGPNYSLSLTQARVNFLLHGISDPGRDDLRAHQDPPEKYAIARVFFLSPDRNDVIERDTGWTSRAFVS